MNESEKWLRYDKIVLKSSWSEGGKIVLKSSWSEGGEAPHTVVKPGLTAKNVMMCCFHMGKHDGSNFQQ
ncbi:hypothetical protein QE152_g4847 [Popillia japonica]|uniref:Uncharacterized protein n=1 Tax=Popillia japonica TaxID=7064 RepID=A0AAW1MZF5_POPJA